MLRRDIRSLEILSGRSLVDGFAATTAIVNKYRAAIQNGYEDDEDDVADDVARGGCEAEASKSKDKERGGLVKIKTNISGEGHERPQGGERHTKSHLERPGEER